MRRRALPNDDDRAGLVDDAFSVAYSESAASSVLADYNVPLSFARQLKHEQAYAVWSPALSHVSRILRLLGGQPTACVDASRQFFLDMIDTQVTALGLEAKAGDDHLKKLLRARLAGAAVVHGHPATVEEAKRIFANATRMAGLGPDEQSTVLKAVVRWGTEADFAEVKRRYLAATFAAEKKRLMYALAAARATKLIDEVLNMAIGEAVRAQDTVSLLAAVARYDEGRARAFTFIQQNWKLLDARYGSGGFALTRLVLTASHFYTQEKLDEVAAFFQGHPVPAAARAVARAEEEVGGAVAWVKEHAGAVCKWFTVNSSNRDTQNYKMSAGIQTARSDEIMVTRAHGTCVSEVERPLRWGADRATADTICCFNRMYAERSGSWEQTSFLRDQTEAGSGGGGGVTTFYDSVTGKALFRAPVGRTWEAFVEESRAHGWPSFRDAEVVTKSIRVLEDGEVVSVDGTHLGHNLPDEAGNRYCINLVSVAGWPGVP